MLAGCHSSSIFHRHGIDAGKHHATQVNHVVKEPAKHQQMSWEEQVGSVGGSRQDQQ